MDAERLIDAGKRLQRANELRRLADKIAKLPPASHMKMSVCDDTSVFINEGSLKKKVIAALEETADSIEESAKVTAAEAVNDGNNT